jgi:hypothetical protein
LGFGDGLGGRACSSGTDIGSSGET